MIKLIFASRYLYHLLFYRFHSLGTRVVFEKNVTIHGANYMQLGNNITLEANTLLSVIDHPQYNHRKPRLVIDDKVGIGYNSLILALNKVHIKKDVMIGPFVTIVDYDHNYKNVKKPINQQGLNSHKSVVISEGSWIGARSTICQGVKIGKNSIIGANSVVTKNIPDYSLAVGIPAKVVKRYDPKTRKWEKVDEKSAPHFIPKKHIIPRPIYLDRKES